MQFSFIPADGRVFWACAHVCVLSQKGCLAVSRVILVFVLAPAFFGLLRLQNNPSTSDRAAGARTLLSVPGDKRLVFILVGEASVSLTHTHTHVRKRAPLSVFDCLLEYRHRQDPEMLAEKHGHEMHAELHSAWQNMHNNSCGGNADAGADAATPVEGSPVHGTVNGTTTAA